MLSKCNNNMIKGRGNLVRVEKAFIDEKKVGKIVKNFRIPKPSWHTPLPRIVFSKYIHTYIGLAMYKSQCNAENACVNRMWQLCYRVKKCVCVKRAERNCFVSVQTRNFINQQKIRISTIHTKSFSQRRSIFFKIDKVIKFGSSKLS